MNPIVSTLLEGMTPGLVVAALMLALLPLLDRNSNWRSLPIAIVLVLTTRYLIWRATSTIPPISHPADFIAGVLFFSVELAAVSGSIISYIMLTRWRDRSPEVDANIGWLRAQPRQPLVDVFICTYNEEREILERTMLGARGMNYANFRVWVLDDGRRAWLKDLAADLGCLYLTRPDNAHAKAGNINHAIRHVMSLPERPDFISILDADFVPTPVLLSRALTLFHAEDVGIVQTPQHFINPDPIQSNLQASDAWPDEQRYFFDVLMPAKDAWGTAFCCGTSSVIRMTALMKAGGFPTESVTEDYLLTLRLKRHGFRTVYLNERLSLGLAPEGLKEYITQRSRWCLGFIQIIRSSDGPFKIGNNLAFLDRVSLIESLLYWAGAYLFRVAGLLVPILYLVFGINAVDVDTREGMSYFMPSYFAQITVMAWLSGQRVLPVITDLSQMLAAREILTAVLVGLFRPKGQKFKVTAKGGDRSKTVIQWRMMVPFAVLLGLTVIGVVVVFSRNTTLQDSSAMVLYWSWYNIIILIATLLTCIEKPRVRKTDRLKGSVPVNLKIGSQTHVYVTSDISLGGMRFLGLVRAPIGTAVTVSVGGHMLAGRIVRRTERDFAVALDESLDTRTAMVREVYSGGFAASVSTVRSSFVARRVLARIFG